MSTTFKAACVQNRASSDMRASIAECDDLLTQAHAQGADLITLPEFLSCLDLQDRKLEVGILPEDQHPALAHFKACAENLGVWILLGSLAIAIEGGNGKANNRSFLIDATGNVVSRYNKIHMFDVDLAGGQSFRESEVFEPGTDAVIAPTPWGRLGMTVCYDLRFAYLYRTLAQAGASFLTVPAAFTKTTGEAHWHTLLRARAIETGSYVIAACQYGTHGEAVTYGHSLIIDPWGIVLAEGGEGSDVIVAEIDPEKVTEARRMIPALTHDRPVRSPASVSAAITA